MKIEKLRKEIAETCSYESWGFDGPNNPGWRLEKYGKDCDYSIRDKEWSVTEDNVGVITINWLTQSTPIEPAVDMLSDAIKAVAPEDGQIFVIQVADRDGCESKNTTICF